MADPVATATGLVRGAGRGLADAVLRHANSADPLLDPRVSMVAPDAAACRRPRHSSWMTLEQRINMQGRRTMPRPGVCPRTRRRHWRRP